MKATRKIAAKRLRLKSIVSVVLEFDILFFRVVIFQCRNFLRVFHSFPSSRSTRFGLSVLLYQHLRTLSNVNFREVKENQAFLKYSLLLK